MCGWWLAVCGALLWAVPAWPEGADPESVLATALDAPAADERLDALLALVELRRLEPVRARAQALLADPSARVRAEALVALAGERPPDELRGLAERWLATCSPAAIRRAPVDDRRFALAAALAELDPACATTATGLGATFPRVPAELDRWLTGAGALDSLGPPYSAALLPALRRVALAWLDGGELPAYATIGRALLAARDPDVVEAALERFDRLRPAVRVFVGCRLLAQGQIGADRAAAVRERCKADAEALFARSPPPGVTIDLLERLVEAGVPEASEWLLEAVKRTHNEAATGAWVRTAAPWSVLVTNWPLARARRDADRDYAVGMMRADAALAVPLLLVDLERRFNWTVWRTLDRSAAIGATDRARLRECIAAASHRRGFFQPPDLAPALHYQTYEIAHANGVPGMVEALVTRYAGPVNARAEVAGCLYRMGATDAARAMARHVLARDGADWSDDATRARLVLAAVLVSADPALAREGLVPLVGGAEPARSAYLVHDPAGEEDAVLLHVAAAVVLAAAGDAGAAQLVDRVQWRCLGWRRFRAVAWCRPADLLGFAAVARAAALTEFRDDPPGLRRPGYRTPPTLDGERAWLAATLATRQLAVDVSSGTLVEVLPTLSDPDARRFAIRALGRVATPEIRAVLAAYPCDGILAAERDAALWVAGDVAAGERIAALLAAPGPGRIPAARALLERPR